MIKMRAKNESRGDLDVGYTAKVDRYAGPRSDLITFIVALHRL